MRGFLLLLFVLMAFTLQGCTTDWEHEFILEGESDHWIGTVNLTLTEGQYKDQFGKKQNVMDKNIVLKPKEVMNLERLTYDTSFNLHQLGNSGSNLVADKNEVLNEKAYGVNAHSGTYLDWSYDELKQKLEYAKIEVEWVKDGEKYKETIMATPK
ncbi:hypothetical protein ACQCN2_23205 [Brevibacillus ginsengisoli]|uniref:hypothetical protein n=1 Tax=Brevibacillus ginsengisoli TaxID=363854 RepID=UPI003CFB3D61